MDPQRLLEDNLALIEQIGRAQCRSHGIFGDEADEFLSDVRLKMIEDDYRRIRTFQGKSLFSTYLHTVISRLFIDMVRQQAGRWRPSETARRLGDTAIELEKLTSRSHHTFDEACHIIASNPKNRLSQDQLYDIYCQLPQKEAFARQVDDPEEALRTVPAPGAQATESLEQKRLQDVQERLDLIVGEMHGALSAEDRLMLKMSFEDDLAVSEIARGLGRERADVDRRLKKLLAGFKEQILAKGININDVLDAIRLAGA